MQSLEVHSGIVVTAFQQGEGISEQHTALATSQQHQVVALLTEYASKDNQDLRVTMAIAGVQGVVHELLRSSKDANDFVVRLRDKHEFIIDLVLRVLNPSD